ncbi:MAG: hypothetical protein H9536_10600 [Aphanizomenon flos-aquae Clear-A1]|nr:hypothetical protein [Aphanizomenon flos-aquae Clear-A1]
MKYSKAIVTLLIGQKYQERWKTICAKNWQQYADKHGYDLVCIDKPLDNSARAQNRSPAWQKCLILGDERVKNYDRVVWIDSDILINPNSPCVVSQVPDKYKIGAVEMFSGPLNESFPKTSGESEMLIDRAKQYWGWSFRTGKEWYNRSDLPSDFNNVVQTGMIVLSPNYHHEILEFTYKNYEQHKNASFEMESLSYELVKTNSVHWLDYRFNRLWIECMLRDYPFLLQSISSESKIIRGLRCLTENVYNPNGKITKYCLTTALLNNFFLHFAGTSQFMSSVNTNVDSWSKIRGKFY